MRRFRRNGWDAAATRCSRFARAGLGVAPLTCYLADPDPALVRLDGPLPEMASALWLLTRPHLRRVARVRAFLNFMAEHLARQRPAFAGKTG